MTVICEVCHRPTRYEYVNGHSMCPLCKQTVDPCCEGITAEKMENTTDAKEPTK
tara:strand:+ start:149 stop:310 length:162 start_codon:yes stop_codon:yes gene_type:complete